jgi:hypothetical protein
MATGEQIEAWMLECLRSRKAGEDLHQLAERLAGVPTGTARDGHFCRTVSLLVPRPASSAPGAPEGAQLAAARPPAPVAQHPRR